MKYVSILILSLIFPFLSSAEGYLKKGYENPSVVKQTIAVIKGKKAKVAIVKVEGGYKIVVLERYGN